MGTRQNCLGEVVIACTNNQSFEQKYKKYQNFFLMKFSFFTACSENQCLKKKIKIFLIKFLFFTDEKRITVYCIGQVFTMKST